MKYNVPVKTVGRRMAALLATLYDRSQSTFTIADVVSITGLSPRLASSLVRKAIKRGLISRPQRGLFVIVPPELGSTVEYAVNPYLLVRQLAGNAPYFVSHASAMEIHRMVTQPQMVVFAASTKRILPRTAQETDFRFVLIKPDHFFGTIKPGSQSKNPSK